MTPVTKLTAASFFSGIGGFDLGFERAGIETIFQCEIDANCRQVLKRHFPHALRHNDIRSITAAWNRQSRNRRISHRWRRVFELLSVAHVWCGGFPCQDLSVAGERAGLAGERSGLWFAFRRLVGLFRPPIVVIENVPGLLSSNGGEDFAEILRGLARLGYDVAWRSLDAQYCGLAQRRERVFIVGCSGASGARPEEILFEPESLCWDPPARGGAQEDVTGPVEARASAGGGFGTDFSVGGGCSQPIPILEAGARTGKSTDDVRAGIGIGQPGDPMFTLQKGKQHAVAFDTTNITSATNRSNPQPGDPCHTLAKGAHPPMIAYGGNNTAGPIDVATAVNAHGGGQRAHGL